MIDSLMVILDKIREPSVRKMLDEKFAFLNSKKRLILITGHRRESFGEGFNNICTAIRALASEYLDYEFVYPVHLNPM